MVFFILKGLGDDLGHWSPWAVHDPFDTLENHQGSMGTPGSESGILNVTKWCVVSVTYRFFVVGSSGHHMKSSIAKVFTDFCQYDEETSTAASLYSDLSQSGSLCFLQISPSPTTPLYGYIVLSPI